MENFQDNQEAVSKKKPQKKGQQNKEKMQNLKKLKVLAIHGYSQSASIFRGKILSFEKFLKKQKDLEVEFIYPQGAFKVQPHSNVQNDSDEFYGWLTMENWETEFSNKTAEFQGFYESFDQEIKPTLEKNKDVDVILAFSQGALFGTLLVAHCIESNQLELLNNLKGIILASGVGSPYPRNLDFAQKYLNFQEQGEQKKYKSIKLPSLHVMGKADEFIPVWRSEKLKDWYSNEDKSFIETIVHDGKHCLPQNASWNQKYLEFIRQCLGQEFEFGSANRQQSDNELEDQKTQNEINKIANNILDQAQI